MTSVDTNVDLIINQLTEEQYLQLSSQGKIDDNQLYLVLDEGDYYRKSETSSAAEISTALNTLGTYECLSNKVSSISEDSTDT